MVKNRIQDVPQESILGSLPLNINTLDMFFEQKDVKLAAYADDMNFKQLYGNEF